MDALALERMAIERSFGWKLPSINARCDLPAIIVGLFAELDRSGFLRRPGDLARTPADQENRLSED